MPNGRGLRFARRASDDMQNTKDNNKAARQAGQEMLALLKFAEEHRQSGAQWIHFGALYGDDDTTTFGEAIAQAIEKAEAQVAKTVKLSGNVTTKRGDGGVNPYPDMEVR